jgi:hypothetical protein
MPRIRCHYEGCIHLESNHCGADVVELDPEMGCLAFVQETEDLVDEEDWDDDLLEDEEEEEEVAEWEDLDEDEDDLDLDDEDEDDW